MADFILHQDTENVSFDAIRHVDADGEFWSARELMALLGYDKWQNFNKNIKRACSACKNSGNPISEHFLPTLVKSTGGRDADNWHLSRMACYLIAMNGDPDKPEIAAAQSYFAEQARRAETIIPVQNEHIRELELELRIRELDGTLLTMHGTAYLALRGVGVAIQEVAVTEVVEPATGRTTKILTADQLKKAVKERTGQRIPSMKSFTDALRKAGRDDLLVPVTRSQTSEHVPPDRLEEAIAIVFGKQRQRLIGE